MVSAVTGSVPYSYLDQLNGGTTPTDVTTPATTTTTPAASSTMTDSSSSTNSSTDNSTTNSNLLGLPPEVLSLLQSVNSNDSAVASLLGAGTASSSASPLSQLTGASPTPSADDIRVTQQSNLLNTQTVAGLYKAALSGAAAKKTTTTDNTDPLQNIISDYNSALNQQTATALQNITNSVNTIS